MKKLSKLILVGCLSFCILFAQTIHAAPQAYLNTEISTTPTEELQKAYDELMYQLNVIWDQKDQAFYQAATDNFRQKAKQLYAKGMDKETIFNFIAKNIKDNTVKSDFQDAINSDVLAQMDAQESMDFVMSQIDLTQQEGSSFTSVISVLGAATLIGLIALAISVPDGSCYDVWYSWGYETYCY